MTEIKLGTFTLTTPDESDKLISMLLWGPAGAGKTTLASTAPGKKLWLLFDPGGVSVLSNRSDVLVADMSGEKHSIVERFKDDNPFLLEKVLKENPDIETVVFDSVTTFVVLATENAIARNSGGKNPSTVEQPQLRGFGHRNAVTLRAMVSLMRLCKRMMRHFIVIAHEASPERDKDGNVMFITIALGGSMPNSLGPHLSEVWYMNDYNKKRKIAVRPVRLQKPMKTTMFNADAQEFEWKYNADTLTGEGIADWFNRWAENGGNKISAPK